MMKLNDQRFHVTLPPMTVLYCCTTMTACLRGFTKYSFDHEHIKRVIDTYHYK